MFVQALLVSGIHTHTLHVRSNSECTGTHMHGCRKSRNVGVMIMLLLAVTGAFVTQFVSMFMDQRKKYLVRIILFC